MNVQKERLSTTVAYIECLGIMKFSKVQTEFRFTKFNEELHEIITNKGFYKVIN